MPLLNYTTKVNVYTTIGEIQAQLVSHGAKRIMQDYDNKGHISALTFQIDTPAGLRIIRLPANVDAVSDIELVRLRESCNRIGKPAFRVQRVKNNANGAPMPHYAAIGE